MGLESYLTNGKEHLKMIESMNIPISPEKHFLKKFGDSLQFTLIFPAIPKDWSTFNFIERTGRKLSIQETTNAETQNCFLAIHESTGLYINNIARNNTGVYRVVIK